MEAFLYTVPSWCKTFVKIHIYLVQTVALHLDYLKSYQVLNEWFVEELIMHSYNLQVLALLQKNFAILPLPHKEKK